ncbi:glycosyltransferase family 2 protein [Sporofaciens musculi]|jgi:glycosyltransferase involved in cell wall biosynthesis|uniref:glycosyltransferase family 2 protein n=1 Tax=Sporofaciens musculi TaxID=2681861 RepID=UPI00216C003E|nr:glycosyltransferase family 2 protein [Sporofaciens musculi]MCI9422793.1 glycosyltransferase family 2 protein [Dorea sp.]
MEQKMISVVIPTYNRKEKLPKCIESVLSQSYKNIEVLVVDDASTDGTEELFREFGDSRLHYLRYETNRGACYARNYGAKRAKGELLAYQDSDDVWHTDKLKKQYEFLCISGADMCFCGMNRMSEGGSRFYYPVHPFHPENALEEFLAENRASTQTMLMYKKVWEQLQFDENIRRYQDWDFGIRAAGSFTLCYLPEALVESEVGLDSISTRVKSYPHLLHLHNKHEKLYRQYPNSDAVMNRRLGKRVHQTDPALAAVHFKKSFGLSRSFYDFGYWMADSFRAMFWNKGRMSEREKEA